MNIKEAFPEYEKPTVAIDTVVLRTKDIPNSFDKRTEPLKSLQILCIHKKNQDLQWQLPGTILRLGESANTALKRIVIDKTHVDDIYFEQLYTVADNPDRDNRGHIISIVYIGIVKDIQQLDVVDGNDYDVEWFWIEKDNKGITLVSEKDYSRLNSMRFDHIQIVQDALTRLRGKLMYTDIGFKFIQNKFTIKELENTFMAIMGNPIPGFRRIISKKVEGTKVISNKKAHRPAELFIQKSKA